MTVTDRLNSLQDRLDAAASPDVHELTEILKVLISNIEIAHVQLGERIHRLEQQLADLKPPS